MVEQEAHAPSLASLPHILAAIPISLADFFALPTSRRDVLFLERFARRSGDPPLR
jgi:hypothetical protein